MDTAKTTAKALLEGETAKTFKGILIDPETNTVKRVEYNGRVEHLHQLLGCRSVDAGELSNGDAVFINNEGQLNAKVGFIIEGAMLPGKGLIIGTDDEGTSTHAKHSVQHISATVRMGTLTRR